MSDELEADLEQELIQAGIVVKSYRGLIHKPSNFKSGIPILIRHMQMAKYPDLTRNFMAQAIAMKEANPYWNILVELFENAVGKAGNYSFEQGLAHALSRAFKEPQLEKLIAMCYERRYGSVRILLADGLKRSRDDRSKTALLELSQDPEIGKQVTKWIKARERRLNLEL